MTDNWFNWMDDALIQIETIFPHCPDEVKRELADRFQHLQTVNDEWLDEWLLLQDRFQELSEKHPELAHTDVTEGPVEGEADTDPLLDEKKETADNNKLDFWIDESVLHQFREGQGYYQLFMFPQALKQFLRVVDTEPDFSLGRLYLALTHFHREQWTEAEKQFNRLLEAEPHIEFQRFSHHMLGCLFVKKQQDVKALRHFSYALELDDDHGDTLFNLGACHFRLKSIRLAIPCFEQAVLIDEDDWESMLYLAACHMAIGFADGAMRWRQLAYETSQKPHIITDIADSYEQFGQHEEALKWHLYCVTKHPERGEGYHGVAWNIWKKEQNPLALVWLKKALSLDREDPNILFSYWWITHSIGTPMERERIDSYLSKMNDSPLWQLAYGNRQRIKGDPERAKQILTPLLKAGETKIQGAAYYQLAHLYMSEQKWEQAVKHFNEARRHDELLHDAWLFEGICHYLSGDEKASRDCLQLYQSQHHSL